MGRFPFQQPCRDQAQGRLPVLHPPHLERRRPAAGDQPLVGDLQGTGQRQQGRQLVQQPRQQGFTGVAEAGHPLPAAEQRQAAAAHAQVQVAAIADPVGRDHRAEAAQPAEALRDPLDQQPRHHQLVCRRQRWGRGQRKLELAIAILRVQLQPVESGGIERFGQCVEVVEAGHQPIGAVGAAGHGGAPGSRRRLGRSHHPIDLETGLHLQVLGGEVVLPAARKQALIGGVGGAIAFVALARHPGPAGRAIEQAQALHRRHQAQIPVGASQRLERIDQTGGAECIGHRREAHPIAGHQRQPPQRYGLGQRRAGVVHEGDRHLAHAPLTQGGQQLRRMGGCSLPLRPAP